MATQNTINTPKISLANTLTTSGNFTLTFTTTNTTSVTLPTTGTLVNTAVASLSSLATVGTVTSGTWSSSLKTYTEIVQTDNTSTAYTINLNNGNVFDLTLTGNCTFSFSNVPASNCTSITLYLHQDGTGSRTVTWPGAVIWPGGTAPTLTTTANHVDVIVMTTVNAGTTWRAETAALNYSS